LNKLERVHLFRIQGIDPAPFNQRVTWISASKSASCAADRSKVAQGFDFRGSDDEDLS
jgi:hypothetical protein